MMMFEMETKKYRALNELAEQDGIVILGGDEDLNIPLGELRQAFDINSKMYNRSIAGLSINDAINVYDACVASLIPETVLLHIGEADLKFFETEPSGFDQKYRELISHIRSKNKKCRIAIVSLKNYRNDPTISELNRHLSYIAESERCEYGDISSRRVWNPKGIMDAFSFVYSMGCVHPFRNKRPVYDLVKILFGYEACVQN